MKKDNKEFSAGIKGHQGLVWGEPKGYWDKGVSLVGKIGGIPMFNFDMWTDDMYSPGNTEDDLTIGRIFDMITSLYDERVELAGYAPIPTTRTKTIKSEGYFEEVLEKQQEENPDDKFELYDYKEIYDEDFYSFNSESERRLNIRTIEIMRELQNQLESFGMNSADIITGRHQNAAEKLGPNPSINVSGTFLDGTVFDFDYFLRDMYENITGPHATGFAVDIEYENQEEKEILIAAIENLKIGLDGEAVGSYLINKDQSYIQIDVLGKSYNGTISSSDLQYDVDTIAR
jgi:hypothetical protein